MSTLYVDNLQPNLGSRVMAAGHVVQVVSGSLPQLQISNETFTDIGSLSITPTSTSSKILIIFENHVYVENNASDAWRGGLVRLLRDATFIYGDDTNSYGEGAFVSPDNDRYMTYSTRQYLDSPNTTSSVTYKVQGCSNNSLALIQFNNLNYGSGGRITLMEIAQ